MKRICSTPTDFYDACQICLGSGYFCTKCGKSPASCLHGGSFVPCACECHAAECATVTIDGYREVGEMPELLVSRAGLEPATTALKVRSENHDSISQPTNQSVSVQNEALPGARKGTPRLHQTVTVTKQEGSPSHHG